MTTSDNGDCECDGDDIVTYIPKNGGQRCQEAVVDKGYDGWEMALPGFVFLQSGASSQAKHGGAYFSANTGSI